MMKILFLDFDGVLNHHAHFAGLAAERVASEVEYDDRSFDKACVERVNVIMRRTGCGVVVSSTWRLMRSPPKLNELLRRHGFASRIVGVTPDHPQGCRGGEIQAWLNRHPGVESFAILDDNSTGTLVDRLVFTTFAFGLTDEHVDRVVALLGGDRQ
jgi:hypothetical protein